MSVFSLILQFPNQAGMTLYLTRAGLCLVFLQGTQATTTYWPASPKSCLHSFLGRKKVRSFEPHLTSPKGLEGRLATTLTKSPTAENTWSRWFLLSLTSILPLKNSFETSVPSHIGNLSTQPIQSSMKATCHLEECLQAWKAVPPWCQDIQKQSVHCRPC